MTAAKMAARQKRGKEGGIDGDHGGSRSQQNRKVVFGGKRWHGQERRVTEQTKSKQAVTRMCAPGAAPGAAVGARSAAIGGRQQQRGHPRRAPLWPSDFHTKAVSHSPENSSHQPPLFSHYWVVFAFRTVHGVTCPWM